MVFIEEDIIYLLRNVFLIHTFCGMRTFEIEDIFRSNGAEGFVDCYSVREFLKPGYQSFQLQNQLLLKTYRLSVNTGPLANGQ